MKNLIIGFILGGLFVWTIVAQADVSNIDQRINQMQLNSEQKILIENIRQKYDQEEINLKNNMKTTGDKLNSLLNNTQSNEEEINKLKTNLKNIQKQITDLEMRYWQEVKNLIK